MTTFADRFVQRAHELNTACIVGLDPTIELMPKSFLSEHGVDPNDRSSCAEALFRYNERVLDAVADLVAAVKPQAAYYELYGAAGFAALERTMASARQRGLLVVLDVKRGDIASTASAYARAYLAPEPKRPFEADAMTVAPYLGEDSLAPFLQAAVDWGKGVFVLAKTSNPGSVALQDQVVDGRRVYEIVADWVAPWAEKSRGSSGYSGLGVVVGVTAPDAGLALRRRLPNSLFLVPGLGAQGGEVTAVRSCLDRFGGGALINSARAIMYPHLSDPKQDGTAADIRSAAQRFISDVRAVTADQSVPEGQG